MLQKLKKRVCLNNCREILQIFAMYHEEGALQIISESMLKLIDEDRLAHDQQLTIFDIEKSSDCDEFDTKFSAYCVV